MAVGRLDAPGEAVAAAAAVLAGLAGLAATLSVTQPTLALDDTLTRDGSDASGTCEFDLDVSSGEGGAVTFGGTVCGNTLNSRFAPGL
jgi:hypothetical protein